MALTDSLIAYWKLEETSGSRADSFGSSTLTDNNTVTSGAGKVGTAAKFDSTTSEWLSAVDSAPLSTGNIDFTIQAWVNQTTKVSNRGIMGKWGDSQNEYLLYWDLPTDRFTFAVSSNLTAATTLSANNFGSPSTGTWYHLLAWHDSVNDSIGICVNNGTPNTAVYSGGLTDGTHFFALGRNGDTSFPQYYTGLIDEAAFWKRMLTSAERTSLYNAGVGLPFDNFVPERWATRTIFFVNPREPEPRYVHPLDSTILAPYVPPEASAWLPYSQKELFRPPAPEGGLATPSLKLKVPLLPGYTGVDLAWFPTAIHSTAPTPPTLKDSLVYPVKPYKLFGFTPSPLPPGPGRSKRTPFIRRWWSAKGAATEGDVDNAERREKRISDQVSICLNSLIGQGQIQQIGNNEFRIVGGSRTEPRDPTPIDDATQGVTVGSLWVNTVTQNAFINVNNSLNAAVWRAL